MALETSTLCSVTSPKSLKSTHGLNSETSSMRPPFRITSGPNDTPDSRWPLLNGTPTMPTRLTVWSLEVTTFLAWTIDRQIRFTQLRVVNTEKFENYFWYEFEAIQKQKICCTRSRHGIAWNKQSVRHSYCFRIFDCQICLLFDNVSLLRR